MKLLLIVKLLYYVYYLTDPKVRVPNCLVMITADTGTQVKEVKVRIYLAEKRKNLTYMSVFFY